MPSPRPPSVIHVGITPSLAPILQENIEDCAIETPGMGMVLDVKPSRELNLHSSDLIIQIGESTLEYDQYAVQIGWEEIILVASPDVIITDPNTNRIKEMFSSSQPKYNIFTYPENHEIRILFDQLFEIEKTSPFGIVVPNPTAMLQSIEQNNNAIGYIPKSWYSGNIPTITMETRTESEYIFPVLVISKQKTQEPIVSFISCLQQEWLNLDNHKD